MRRAHKWRLRDDRVHVLKRGTTQEHQTSPKAQANRDMCACKSVAGPVCGGRVYCSEPSSWRLARERVISVRGCNFQDLRQQHNRLEHLQVFSHASLPTTTLPCRAYPKRLSPQLSWCHTKPLVAAARQTLGEEGSPHLARTNACMNIETSRRGGHGP